MVVHIVEQEFLVDPIIKKEWFSPDQGGTEMWDVNDQELSEFVQQEDFFSDGSCSIASAHCGEEHGQSCEGSLIGYGLSVDMSAAVKKAQSLVDDLLSGKKNVNQVRFMDTSSDLHIVKWVPEAFFAEVPIMPCPDCNQDQPCGITTLGWTDKSWMIFYSEKFGQEICIIAKEYQCNGCGIKFNGWNPRCVAKLSKKIHQFYPFTIPNETAVPVTPLPQEPVSPVLKLIENKPVANVKGRSFQYCSVCFNLRREKGRLVDGHKPDGYCPIKCKRATADDKRELRRLRQKLRRAEKRRQASQK